MVEESSSDEHRRTGQQDQVREGACTAVMQGAGETYVSAFALLLHATPFQIGLLSAVPPVVGTWSQLLSVKLLDRLPIDRACRREFPLRDGLAGLFTEPRELCLRCGPAGGAGKGCGRLPYRECGGSCGRGDAGQLVGDHCAVSIGHDEIHGGACIEPSGGVLLVRSVPPARRADPAAHLPRATPCRRYFLSGIHGRAASYQTVDAGDRLQGGADQVTESGRQPVAIFSPTAVPGAAHARS